MSSEVTEDTIVAALEELRKNDTNSVQLAGNYLLNVMNNPANLIILFSIIDKGYPDFIRQLSGLFCRRMIFQFYSQFDASSRENMKHCSIDFLRKEKNNLVKRAICGMVSAIANIEVPKNGWDEMKETIISCLHSSDWQDRESGILLLFSISDNVFSFYDTDTLNQIIISGFQDSSPDVVYMSVKAATSIFTQAILSKNIKALVPSIQCSIQLIPILMNNHCEEYGLMLFSVYNDIVITRELPDEIVLSLMELCLPFLQSEEYSFDIKQMTTSVLASSIRFYSILLLKHKLVAPFIKTCVEHLSDGVTEIEDDEEIAASLYELLLDQIASILPCDMVFNEVMSLSFNQLGSPSWQQRRSALTAMLVIIEYTSDIYRPSLSNILAQIRPLLFDPIRAVRRKAAFFFSEIADYCSSVFVESAPFIQEDIQKILNTNDEYDITSVMYILECCTEIYEGMNQEGIEMFTDTLLSILVKAEQLHTQSLALSCLYTVVDSVPEKSESRLDACIEVAYRLLLQPYTTESSDVHEKSINLLGIILRRCGIERLQSILPSVLEYLYQLVSSVQDFDVYSLVFPFISVVATKAQDSAEITQYLDNFVPVLKYCVFTLSIYVEVKVPSATKEYGSLGGSFSDVEQRFYRLVHLDTNRVQCKSLALDTYLSICESRMKTQGMIEEEVIDRLTESILFFCQNSNAVMHTHGNRGAVTLVRIIKMNEQLKNPGMDPCKEKTNPVLRYSLVFLHQFRVLLEKEKDEEVAFDMIHSIELIGLVVGPRFYIDGFKGIDAIITSAFKYNLLSEEEYIDDSTYDVLHDECPVVTQAILLFESMFLSFPEVASVLTVAHCQELWNLLKVHLIPETDGLFLARIFHLASMMLEYLQSQAGFLATDLIDLLRCSLQNPNESCRGEAFRCLGWICQIFPNQMSSMIDNVTDCILEAMERRQGDSGEAADLATSALNRILKNVMDSPKQKLFVNVLTHLPPLKDVSEAESIYKTLFDMYENKGEMFNQFAQPLINAFVRSLMNGNNLSDSIKQKIYNCLLSMYQENAQAFSSIINTFSPEEIGFVTNLFSSI